MSVKDLLTEEIERQIGTLEDLEFGSDQESKCVGNVTKLLSELNEMNRIENDMKEKEESRKAENDLKLKQMSEEKFDHIVKNTLTGVSVIGGFILTVWGTKKSIEFEKTGTITTMAGRAFINKLFSKK